MSFMKEFKEFAVKGNAVDMAVGIIIGAAFGKIVTSLVTDVLMPPIGLLLGGTDFAKQQIVLQKAAVDPKTQAAVPEVVMRYGACISTVIDFIIVAFCLFIAVKAVNALRRSGSEPARS